MSPREVGRRLSEQISRLTARQAMSSQNQGAWYMLSRRKAMDDPRAGLAVGLLVEARSAFWGIRVPRTEVTARPASRLKAQLDRGEEVPEAVAQGWGLGGFAHELQPFGHRDRGGASERLRPMPRPGRAARAAELDSWPKKLPQARGGGKPRGTAPKKLALFRGIPKDHPEKLAFFGDPGSSRPRQTAVAGRQDGPPEGP